MVKNILQIAAAFICLSCGVAWAQSGTVNTLSVNPRQNLELSNSTGTETGQPSDAVPGSQDQENGLTPNTSNMTGSGSTQDLNQNQSSPTAAAAPNRTNPPGQTRNEPAKATEGKKSGSQ
jgi:hypothetical protein